MERLGVFLFGLSFILSSWSFSEDLPKSADPNPNPQCKACKKKVDAIRLVKEEMEKNKHYLGKNRDFLFNLSAKEAKFLKVKGNEQMILKNLDRIKAKLENLQTDFSQGGCEECEKESIEKYDGK